MDPEIRLIRNIQRRRSRKAADLLVRNYYREIYVYVFRQLGNKEDAMDLTQDIFIAVLQSIDRFDSAKSTFRTWLYGIATHKVIDFRRKEKPAWLSLDEAEIPDETDHLEMLRDAELIRKIEEYVSGADETAQMIFRLHLFDEKNFREIAEITGLPEATAKTKYYRLQKKLREEFGEC